MIQLENKVLVFHGLDSSCGNQRYQHLIFPKIDVDIDHESMTWKEIHDTYKNVIESEMGRGKALIFLGHSLGGWWARYFSKKYNMPAILLNPLVDVYMAKVDIPNHSDYRANQLAIHPGDSSLYYYIEMPDEVINYSNLDSIESEGAVVLSTGHHRIKHPENINILLKRVVDEELSF